MHGRRLNCRNILSQLHLWFAIDRSVTVYHQHNELNASLYGTWSYVDQQRHDVTSRILTIEGAPFLLTRCTAGWLIATFSSLVECQSAVSTQPTTHALHHAHQTTDSQKNICVAYNKRRIRRKQTIKSIKEYNGLRVFFKEKICNWFLQENNRSEFKFGLTSTMQSSSLDTILLPEAGLKCKHPFSETSKFNVHACSTHFVPHTFYITTHWYPSPSPITPLSQNPCHGIKNGLGYCSAVRP